MDNQVENAIEIAWNPASDHNLRSQALNFLNGLRANPVSSWQVCLSLFTRVPPPQEVVRHFALEVVNLAVQGQQLDVQSLVVLRDNLMEYIRRTFTPVSRPESVDTAHIQNKIAQTMTYLFASLYASGWESFFDDFRVLAGNEAAIGTENITGTVLYLRVLGSVHDEIADVLLSRTPDEQKRSTELKDLIRVRDAQKIAQSWQELLAKWNQTDPGIIEMCLRTISRWVSWSDIALVVNQPILQHLFALVGQQGIARVESPEAKVKNAAIDTFTEIVAKKMKPADKIELITFLDLGNVVAQLVASPSLSELRTTPDYDTDLAETVAKLVNNTVVDIIIVLSNDSTDAQTRQRAEGLVSVFMPHLLRFFSDQYDEICSTVITALTEILTYFRKITKNQPLPPQYAGMVSPALDAIIMKMKYDETASWGEEAEQTDEAEFQELRKRLHVLQQTVALIDEPLYINTLSNVVATTFQRFAANDANLNWRDLDLALHEMYLFGELAMKNTGLYTKKEPSSIGSQRLIEMMMSMVDSDIASYRHPAIQLQYMEICVRYFSFFEQNTNMIPKVLESFVRLTHSNYTRVKSRSWYLFLRLVRPLRNQIAPYAKMVVQAIGDLLTIRAELPEDGSDDMSSDEEDKSADAMFNNQLYLFEAIGCIGSSLHVPVEEKVLFAQSVINPLLVDLEQNLQPAKAGDSRAVLQIHHIIQAIGTVARGFSETASASLESTAGPTSGVAEEFVRASEAILIALESLNNSLDIRTAARFAFSRLITVLESRILQQLTRWIDGLLSQSSSKDEMAMFLRVLDQVLYAFKSDILGILDTLLTPLLQRVFTALGEPTNGTDDEIQLAELRREYLNFILIILNQDLGSVLVSSANQTTFENIISTAELFARDPTDYPNARLSVGLLIKMTSVWGGADRQPTSTEPPNPSLPGFDTFTMTRFSALCWAVPSTPGFDPKDPQARQVLNELALLQIEILKKNGAVYLERVGEELRGIGVASPGLEEYLKNLTQAVQTEKAFKQFFVRFVGSK